MKNLVIYLNAGHGNFENGKYHTFAHDGKFYHFTDNRGKIILSAYEGQTNRIFATLLLNELVRAGAEVVRTYHSTNDLTNLNRLNIANGDHTRRITDPANKGKKYLYLSLHSNAFSNSFSGEGTTANGIEVFTSPGRTASDAIAERLMNELRKSLAPFNINFRTDMTDSDQDKEANFTELVGTAMPAVLIENLFFTNFREAKLLVNPKYQVAFVNGTMEMLKWYAAN